MARSITPSRCAVAVLAGSVPAPADAGAVPLDVPDRPLDGRVAAQKAR